MAARHLQAGTGQVRKLLGHLLERGHPAEIPESDPKGLPLFEPAEFHTEVCKILNRLCEGPKGGEKVTPLSSEIDPPFAKEPPHEGGTTNQKRDEIGGEGEGGGEGPKAPVVSEKGGEDRSRGRGDALEAFEGQVGIRGPCTEGEELGEGGPHPLLSVEALQIGEHPLPISKAHLPQEGPKVLPLLRLQGSIDAGLKVHRLHCTTRKLILRPL